MWGLRAPDVPNPAPQGPFESAKSGPLGAGARRGSRPPGRLAYGSGGTRGRGRDAGEDPGLTRTYCRSDVPLGLGSFPAKTFVLPHLSPSFVITLF